MAFIYIYTIVDSSARVICVVYGVALTKYQAILAMGGWRVLLVLL